MKIAAWVGVIYFAVVGANNFMSTSLTGSTDQAGGISLSGSSTLRNLPEVGTIIGNGTTAGIADLGIAAAIYFFALR